MQLDGRRIIVTGGASGIGASAIRALAAEGARVASLDVRDQSGRKVVARARAEGPGTARYYHCDISTRAAVDDAFKSAVGFLDGLDALVHAGGVARQAPAEDITDEEWDLIFDVNVKGTSYTNQASFRYMKDHGGRILNFGSAAGMNGYRKRGHYAASKGAVLAWTRTAAQEWGKYGITVNAVAPAMWTPMFETTRARMSPEELRATDATYADRIPIGGRLGDPDHDLAPVLIFLVGEGSRFITGQTIAVDGGFLMVR